MTAPKDILPDARYSIAEAAAIISKTKRTIYRYAEQGLLTIRYNNLGIAYIQGKQLKALLA